MYVFLYTQMSTKFASLDKQLRLRSHKFQLQTVSFTYTAVLCYIEYSNKFILKTAVMDI